MNRHEMRPYDEPPMVGRRIRTLPHRRDADGMCVRCEVPFPCRAAALLTDSFMNLDPITYTTPGSRWSKRKRW